MRTLFLVSVAITVVFASYHPLPAQGWYIQTVDSEGLVGAFTSLATDKNDNPRISYFGNGSLKYAAFNGSSWAIETVDSTMNVGAFVLARSSSGIGGADFVRDFDHDFGFLLTNRRRG